MSTIPDTPVTATSTTQLRSSRHQLDIAVADTCINWWSKLNDIDPKTGKEGPKPKRAALAELRRIRISEVPKGEEVDVSATIGPHGYRAYRSLTHDLRKLVGAWKGTDHLVWSARQDNLDFDAAVAVVAATLARVRENEKRPVAKRLGTKTRDEAPLMAEARFKRLIRTTDAPDLLDQGRRIVMLLGRTASVGDLGASLLLWTIDPYAKRRWSFAYYDADMSAEADAEPDDAAPATPTTNT